ncbi:MAG: sigma-70 family RNA polymerase sigma factor [Ferruginibacter sp.]|nr:sigma-70 family RNA polymerase sigma factor [Cytophagales bacterium]
MSEQLIRRCQAGDSRAQRTLYERFANRMFRVCFRYIRDELHAEDVLLKGFLKVFQHVETFEYRGEPGLEAWIKRIMVNEALMLLRQKHNFNLVTDTHAEQMDSGFSPDADLNAEEIYALILQLPTGYRTVFNLFVVEGYSHGEIAGQLRISENTSKSQLSKAKATLRILLTKHGITHGD